MLHEGKQDVLFYSALPPSSPRAAGASGPCRCYPASRPGPPAGRCGFRAVDPTTTGLGTRRAASGTDPLPLFQDWTVANYLDDLGINSETRYQQPSWNFRDIFTKTEPDIREGLR